MKVHRVLAEAAYALLEGVFTHGRVLDHELGEAFSENPKWGKRDRSFLAETVFEVVRWRRALAFVAGDEEIPSMCAVQWTRMGLVLPDWLGWSGERVREAVAHEDLLRDQPRAVRESVPDWLDALGKEELGERWDAEIAALNQRAPVFLRVNTLKGTVESTLAWLGDQGVEALPVEGVPEALVLPAGRILPKAVLLDGRVEIQDAGSQCIVPLLDPQPGETVIDACAGAGGKFMQIAARMRNQGTLIAMDVASRKLDTLRHRAKRAGVTRLRTMLAEDAVVNDLSGKADRVLIDSPCSGLGTLRRQPDLKWRITPKSLEKTRRLQRELLSRHAALAREGGMVVYATCSILPSENRGIVESLLEKGGYRLLREITVSPAATGFDGFYAASLERVGC
jgi:16S rRNA (cytosine967-C5)-methyltransferase